MVRAHDTEMCLTCIKVVKQSSRVFGNWSNWIHVADIVHFSTDSDTHLVIVQVLAPAKHPNENRAHPFSENIRRIKLY